MKLPLTAVLPDPRGRCTHSRRSCSALVPHAGSSVAVLLRCCATVPALHARRLCINASLLKVAPSTIQFASCICSEPCVRIVCQQLSHLPCFNLSLRAAIAPVTHVWHKKRVTCWQNVDSCTLCEHCSRCALKADLEDGRSSCLLLHGMAAEWVSACSLMLAHWSGIAFLKLSISANSAHVHHEATPCAKWWRVTSRTVQTSRCQHCGQHCSLQAWLDLRARQHTQRHFCLVQDRQIARTMLAASA